MSTKLNRHQIARFADRAALTGGLPEPITAALTDLVESIDDGASGGKITAAVDTLIANAWASTARAAAAAEKPADQRKCLTALRSVAQLESQLGLSPQPEPATEPVDEPVSAPVADTGYGYASDDGFGGAA